VPYLASPPPAARPQSPTGLGAAAGDPRYGSPGEWEAYHSRIAWRRLEAQSGPRGDEWGRQATWAAAALQMMIEGKAVAVRPFPTDPELLAIIVNGRSRLLTLPKWELESLFPSLTPSVLAYARGRLLPGRDVVAIAQAKLRADITRLRTDLDRLVLLQAELQRYQAFAAATLKQYQTYVTWFAHHLKKKAKRTEIVSGALTAIAAVLYWVPVVGWALGLAVDAANVAYQLDAMKKAIAAMEAAGARVDGAITYVAIMEALAQVSAELENALALVDNQLWFAETMAEDLQTNSQSAAGGSPLVSLSAPTKDSSLPAASDYSIIRAIAGEARRAFTGAARGTSRLVVAGVAVAVAAWAFLRRRH